LVKFFLLCLLSITLLFSKSEQKLKEEKLEIIKIVMNTEGFITESIHKEFWNGLEGKLNPKDFKFLDEMILFSQKLQQKIWRSVLISLEKNIHYKSDRLKKLIKIAETIYGKNSKQMQENISKIDNIINLAVEKKPLYIHGNATYITADKANEVLSGLSAAFERIELLLDPNWNPQYKERKISDEVKLLWNLPLTKKIENIRLNNKEKKLITYTSTISENSMIAISVIKSNTKKDTKNCIKGASSQIGVSNPIIIDSYFQSYPTSKSLLKIKDTNGALFINLVCIATNTNLYTILSLSDNVVDSNLYQSDILKNIIFME